MTRILVVLNALVLLAGLGLSYLAARRVPDLPEINADKVRLWSQPETYSPATPATAKTRPGGAAGEGVCLSLAELDQQRFVDLREVLKAAGYAETQCRLKVGRKLGWWVFWPPEYDAAQRAKVLQALRAAGVEDFLRVREGSMAQAYSLGVFSLEAQARQHRDSLRRKGLEGVEYGPRPGTPTSRLDCGPAPPEQVARLQASLPAWAQMLEPAQCRETGAAE